MNLKQLLAQSIFWRCSYFFSVLLVNIFLSRYLKASATGNLYFITIILSFLQTVLSLGVEAGVTYFASGGLIPRNKLISIIISWSFVAGIASVAVIQLYFIVYKSQPQQFLMPYCIYAFSYITGLSLTNFTTALFYTRENYLTPNLLMSVINVLFLFFIPGKNAVKNHDQAQVVLYLFFLTYLISGLLMIVVYVLINKSESSFKFPPVSFYKKFLRYSLTAVLANIIFFLVYRIDYLFVKQSPVCTNADLGNYIQVSKLGQLMLIIPLIIGSVLFPRTATGINTTVINNQIMIIARLMSQLYLLVFLGVLLLGKWIFILVFGETFNAMQLPMLILIPGIFSLSVLALLSAYFSGTGRVKINLQGAVIALAVMIAGDYFFVPVYGIIAAALISTISYAVNLSYSLWKFYKDYSVSWIDFFKWRKTDYNWFFTLLANRNNI